jgi:hypothetical protein
VGRRDRGSLIVERNVLEWRFDPRSDARDRYDVELTCIDGRGISDRESLAWGTHTARYGDLPARNDGNVPPLSAGLLNRMRE